jgi:DNA-binding CsgD family transcriptional regulator
MVQDRRLTEWVDLAGDLLQRPLPQFPGEAIGRQLTRSYSVTAVSWEWREDPSRLGFRVWPEIDFTPVAHLPPWHVSAVLDRHPLVRWFVVSQDPAPQTTGRLPEDLAPRRDLRLVTGYLRPLGLEQQLTIPYQLHQNGYGAFVLGRPDIDFDDADLELAGHLQRLICGLHRRTAPIVRATQAASRCDVGDRVGLTTTELAVLTLLGEGHTAYSIGLRLDMAAATAAKHLQHVYRKLGVHDRLAAVLFAREAGLIPAPSGGSPESRTA